MPKDIFMPALSAGMEEGHLVRWLKKEGEAIKRGDLLAEIETDKAVMEMEADADGRLGPILVGDGSRAVAVGTLIASILAEGETAPARPAVAAPVAVVAAVPPAPVPLAPVPPAPVVPAPQPVPAAPTRPASLPLAERAPSLAALVAARKVVASPLARRLADDYGVDLSGLTGSGPRGRIVRIDVERARQVAPQVAPQFAPQPAAVPAPRPAVAVTGVLNSAWLRKGEGRPLVLVHGFGSELNGWRPFLAGADVTRPVLGIDLPGHGGSAGHGASTFAEMVAAVGETLDALGLSGFDLVAHSLGAAVSMALAGEGWHDVRSLFLIAPAGLGPDINGAFIEGFARARSAESLAPWMAELVADASVLSPAFVKASAAARADGALVAAQQRLAERLFPDGTQAFSARAALEKIAAPVCVVFGGADRIIPAAHLRRVPGAVAQHLFPGVGHMPQLEIREAVWRLLERHLRAAP
ncbi:acetoin dehydrogenase dihydrolipoyllysine-residue acetyltransferase subunit [Xanthobacter autotrophicus DSM 431]|uniref:acetoin dehydrogenase dihydrolipoyllysine-residue acetyltransferase subunit n=1 Tax=Xanthobacter nonsaccharivorans TaxID=3119912 RepID=UPI003729C486